MVLLWEICQLAFWCVLFVLVLAATAAVILAPPVVAARWAWKRWA